MTELFLALNGLTLAASDESVVATWRALAAGEMDESQFTRWPRADVV